MEYQVVSEFICHGSEMVTVKFKDTAHTMYKSEWQKIYEREYKNGLCIKVNRNSYGTKLRYKAS